LSIDSDLYGFLKIIVLSFTIVAALLLWLQQHVQHVQHVLYHGDEDERGALVTGC